MIIFKEVDTIRNLNNETKELFKRKVVFADVINGSVYDGESVILPEDLQELDSAEVVNIDDGTKVLESIERFRDLLQQVVVREDENTTFVTLIAIENQTKVHYAMPVRNMLYDAMTYVKQIKAITDVHKDNGDKWEGAEFLSGLKKVDKLKPVITTVVYLGTKIWDGPNSLYDMLEIKSEKIKKWIPNYEINLISPVSMSKEEIGNYKSEFRELAELINCANDRKALVNLVQGDEKYKNMDVLTADIASRCLNFKLDINGKEGKVDMCKAIEDLRQDGYNEGMEIGYSEGKNAGRNDGIQALISTLKDFCPNFDILYSKVVANKIYANLTREDVMRYY